MNMKLENKTDHVVKRFNTVDLKDIACDEYAIISSSLSNYLKQMQDIEIDKKYIDRVEKVLNTINSIYE